MSNDTKTKDDENRVFCRKCGEERPLKELNAIHSPPAPMMFLRVYGGCPNGCKQD